MDFMKIDADFIINWCVEHNEITWLKAKAAEKKIGKDGKERAITFVEMKLDFVKKFMPELAPKAKEKKPTMFDRIAAL